ncbi:MAG: DUF2244 domain-containing protein [Brevirhabdus sp.]
MPYEWTENPQAPDPTCQRVTLWPHRSLHPKGFAAFIVISCAMLAMPLGALVGTAMLWVMLPFLALAVGGIWFAIQRSYDDGQLCEELTLCNDQLRLVRHNPRGAPQTFEANPYWIRLGLHAENGPVENYLTLKGAGREVELGAFLSPEERLELHGELARELGRIDCNAR